jgi:nucleoside-diphosphate-sugar epimerase
MDSVRRRVLITGGTGFIGASLARDLITGGHEVHLLARSEAGLWRLEGLHGRFALHRADLRDASAVREAVRGARPDTVFHAAAHGTMPGRHDRQAVLASNLLGTANLLDALEGCDYQRLVHVGSSSEYGHVDRPMREDDRLLPRTDYGVGKAAATLLCQAEALRGRPVCTVRVFSAYGPWEDPSRLASHVLDCCRRGVRPGVTAGRQPRDFVYIDDVINLLKAAASHPDAPGEVLHAGTGRRQTVRDLVEAALAVCTGGRLAAEYGAAPARPDEPATWVADIAHTTAAVGWRPAHGLEAGVRRMWAWFRARSAARAA